MPKPTYTAAISTGRWASQLKKQPIKHTAMVSGAKTIGDFHPLVVPDVKAKINRMRATARNILLSACESGEEESECQPVNKEIPQRSRLLNLDTFDWKLTVDAGWAGIMMTQNKAIGMVINARNQKTQRHDAYCTNIAPIINPRTEYKNKPECNI